jgi:selenocysteine lyase/cysteine desulfurase
VLSLFGQDAPRVGVLSFTTEGWDSADLAEALSVKYGIGVRAGLFCAHPLVRTLLDGGPEATGCGTGDLNAVRVSFGAGTPDEHVDRFLTAVRELATSRRAQVG